MESCGVHETTYNSIMKCELTSVRTCTPTPSCLVAPPCTQVLPTECKRKSLPWLHPPSRSKSLLHLPTDVDHQARIRRMRPIHCPQKMLLNAIILLLHIL